MASAPLCVALSHRILLSLGSASSGEQAYLHSLLCCGMAMWHCNPNSSEEVPQASPLSWFGLAASLFASKGSN